MRERDAGEITAPAERHAAAAERRQEAVAAVGAARVTLVGALPDAVARVRTGGLGQYVFEFNLETGSTVNLNEEAIII